MNVRNTLKKVFANYVAYHLMAMFAVVVLICVGAGIALGFYTRHGKEIIVPALNGMTFDQAYTRLEERGLLLMVSDSGYNKQLPANTILAQNPSAGLHVKEGRIVYVTVNSPSSPTFALPDVVDNSSLREAEAKLTAMGFRLTAPQQIEGEKDWVYGILCRGRRVAGGDRISIEYPLTLLVGKGSQDERDDIGVADEGGAPVEEGVEYEEVKEAPVAGQQ